MLILTNKHTKTIEFLMMSEHPTMESLISLTLEQKDRDTSEKQKLNIELSTGQVREMIYYLQKKLQQHL